MDWRTLLDPAGPLPRSVYWLRRAAVGLVLVVVVAVIAIAAGHSGGGKHTASGTTHPSAAAGVTPPVSPVTTAATTPVSSATGSASAPATTPAPTPSAGGTCPADTLSVTLATSAAAYGPSGAPVHFTAVLRTTHAEACTVPGPLVIVVTSGTDRVWGSADCTPADTAATTALAAHGDATATRTWDRGRSRPGCTAVVGDTVAAAGHYAAVATWAGVSSAAATFRLE